MKNVTLTKISEIKTEKSRTDGKVSRQYYTAYFADASNPFAPARQRNIFQTHNADGTACSWKSGDPAIVAQFVGKQIPGEFVNVTTKPYDVNGRMVTSYTTVLLAGENLKAVLKQSGVEMAVETSQVEEGVSLN